MHLNNLIKLLIIPRPFLAWLLLLLSASWIVFLASQGYLDPLIAVLDSENLSFYLGDVRLSAYLLIKSLAIVLTFFWVSSISLDFIETKIERVTTISSNYRALLIKVIQFGVYLFFILFALKIIGIDLTAFAVLGGALGIGIGFGLQKITSNYISGIILLLEKTIEAGDVVELDDGTFGFVRHNKARYTLIETFNGKEIMVPNEDFITNRVINWTYSNTKARIEITVGVSYKSDIEKAQALLLEAALEHPRCALEPKAECFLREFADSSVNFLLYVWINDVTEGRYRTQSEVMFAIWKKFKENDISIPFPQRDVHLIDR